MGCSMALGFRSPMYFCLDFGCGGCFWATVLEIESGIGRWETCALSSQSPVAINLAFLGVS